MRNGLLLYHTKNHRGTTTIRAYRPTASTIIPYQEPPGNYNFMTNNRQNRTIIPYQEPPGNYNYLDEVKDDDEIIPYQEPPGNYNR